MRGLDADNTEEQHADRRITDIERDLKNKYEVRLEYIKVG
jgi:hypothetical protein